MADRDADRNLFPDKDDEEFAAEVSPARLNPMRHEAEPTASGAIVGYIALAVAVLSFFTYPVVFGIAAVILGFFARSRDARTTGRLAIVIGGIAALVAIFFRVALITALVSLFR